MQESTSREKILKKVRKALIARDSAAYLNADFESPVFAEETDAPEIVFAQRFTELAGHFVFCIDEQEAVQQLKELFAARGWKQALCREEEAFYFLEKAGIETPDEPAAEEPRIAVSLCECLVARSGSFFISSARETGRRFIADADVHIIIAFTSQLVKDIKGGFDFMKTKYEGRLPSLLTLVSGPSKTADIEQQLVYGAHAAREVYCFLVE